MMNHRDTKSLCKQAGISVLENDNGVQIMRGKRKLKVLKDPTHEELDAALRKEAIAEIDYMTACF